MAGIDSGGARARKRATNHDIPLIPMIDFLLCLVAFLLVTAVWTQLGRINAAARAPGQQIAEPSIPKREKQLDVETRGESKFRLVWKEGDTVLDTIDVERKPITVGSSGDLRFPALAQKIAEEWNANGAHRAGSDEQFDRAVLHTDNATPFSDLIAVIDAIHAPKRDFDFGGKTQQVPSFSVIVATD